MLQDADAESQGSAEYDDRIRIERLVDQSLLLRLFDDFCNCVGIEAVSVVPFPAQPARDVLGYGSDIVVHVPAIRLRVHRL